MHNVSLPENISTLCNNKIPDTDRFYLNIKELCMTPGDYKSNGYQFEYILEGERSYRLIANPIVPGESGRRYFVAECNLSSGKLIYVEDKNKNGKIDPDEPLIQSQE